MDDPRRRYTGPTYQERVMAKHRRIIERAKKRKAEEQEQEDNQS